MLLWVFTRWAWAIPAADKPFPVPALQQALHALATASERRQPLAPVLADVQTQFHALDQYVDTLLYLPASREATPARWLLLLDGIAQQPLPIMDNTTRQTLLAYRHAVARIAYQHPTAATHAQLHHLSSESLRIGESLAGHRATHPQPTGPL